MESLELQGILIVDKPPGLSSMAAVALVRRKAGGIKTGHAGTLDPLAEGVLVMALGKATRCIDQLMATDKLYRTVIDLGAFTATDDREGNREEVAVAAPPSREQVERALERFKGEIRQRPPSFSAMKVGGRRAYQAARSGKPLALEPRSVLVHSLRVMRYDWPRVELEIRSGKGFYVRALARDLGVALGTGGHCATLRRTAVGPFTEAMAIALDEVPEPVNAEHLLSVEKALRMVRENAMSAGTGR